MKLAWVFQDIIDISTAFKNFIEIFRVTYLTDIIGPKKMVWWDEVFFDGLIQSSFDKAMVFLPNIGVIEIVRWPRVKIC